MSSRGSGQQIAQLREQRHRDRGLDRVRPGLRLPVHPNGLHPGGLGPQHIQMGVIPHVQHLFRRYACGLGGGVENAHGRLSHTEGGSTHAGGEELAQAHAGHVGIAIGQGHHGVTPGQPTQGRQGVGVQRHVVAFGKENIESFVCQQRVFARTVQRQANGLAADGTEVVPQFRAFVQHVLAQILASLGIGKQRRCHGRLLPQPGGEDLLGPLDGGPDGPQGVVQVQGNGAYAGRVEHGGGEYRMAFTPEPSFTHGQPTRTAILYGNLGTPDAPTAPALRRYLAQFLGDPRVVEIPKPIWWLILHGIILRTRPAKSAAKYASVWTPEGSPLMVWTQKQANLLKGFLGEQGHHVEVRVAMTYGNPGVAQEMDKLKAEGFTRILVLPAYPQYSGTTTAALFDTVYRWARRTRHLPELRFVNRFHDDPGYINALAATVRKHWQANGQPERLVMSFHGVPERTLHLGDPYHCECHKTGRLLAEALGLGKHQYTITFQSRFGKAKWLEPYTEPTLVALAQAGIRKVDVMCPGFTGDCLETLEEISMEAREAFLHAGGTTFSYIPCLNDSPDFIRALAQLTQAHLGGWPTKATPDAAELTASKERAVAMGAKQ